MSDEIWMYRNADGSRCPYFTSAEVVAKYPMIFGTHGLPTRPATREEIALHEEMHRAAMRPDGDVNYDAPESLAAYERLKALMLLGWGDDALAARGR